MAEPSYLERSKASKRLVDLQARREARDKAKHDTMSGMTIQQAKKIRELEEKHADDFTESSFLVDKNGKVVAKSKGKESATTTFLHANADYSDCIMTHNHPHHEFSEDGSEEHIAEVTDARDMKRKEMVVPNGLGIAGRIGNSLSAADIFTAARHNMKGIRTRTPTYEFSVQRGDNGWGGTPDEIAKFVKSEFLKVYNSYYTEPDFDRDEGYRLRHSRINALASHKAIQAAAEKFGWKYTRVKRAERSKHDANIGGLTESQRKAMAQERARRMSAKERNRLQRALLNSL